jgi:hypothetical protein
LQRADEVIAVLGDEFGIRVQALPGLHAALERLLEREAQAA